MAVIPRRPFAALVESSGSRLRLSDPSAPAEAEDDDVGRGDLLAERWQRGIDREETFREIYQSYCGKIYRFFLRRGFRPDECMDLAQETFLRAHKSLATFRGECHFEAWLFKIATNIYRNRLRSLGARKRDAQEVAFEDGDAGEPAASRPETIFAAASEQGPLEDVLSEERARLLRAAMENLPAQMRRCVLLRVDGELKYREIADLMQVSVETVKAHLFQARQQLKGRLADYFTDLEI
jgi:RNA polymerase sigma-70 factor (ECF subfamily)